MHKYFEIIVLIIFILLCIQLMRVLFMKIVYHKRLLRELYPNWVNKKGWFGLWKVDLSNFDFHVILWYFFPVYYSNISSDLLFGNTLFYHLKLIKINRSIGISFLSLIIFLVCLIGYSILGS